MAGLTGKKTERREEFVAAPLPEFHHGTDAPDGTSVRNILLPLDGRDLSKVAIPVALGLAQLYQATLHVIYAGAERVAPETKLAQLGVHWEELPGAVIDQAVGCSPPEAILSVEQALPAPLIVMCTRTGRTPKADCFGSVTEELLVKNPERIVLVAPEQNRATFKISKIVLAHDGTPAADCAIALAAQLAARARASVTAIHVAAPREGAPKQSGSLPAPQYVDQPQHEWPSWTAEFSARMQAMGAPASALNFKLLVKGGQPGSEIALLANRQKADLVVMGNPGNWHRSRRSLTRVVIQTSGCPVLLVCAHRSKQFVT
jgi:nucleotide-binding universal stress UspA family protein